jgi:hypothetical protein
MKIPLAISFLIATLPLHGQPNASATNAPLKLLPPYGELPPTFWEQRGTVIVVAGLGIIALAAGGLWLVYRSRPKTILPPEAQARQALERLRPQPEDGAVLSRVSQIVRNYFIAAFQLPPGEFTTAEFSRAISSHEKIGAELSTGVADFLRDCDDRKFSPAKTPTPIDAVKQALELIGRGESRLAQLRQTAAVQAENKTSTHA